MFLLEPTDTPSIAASAVTPPEAPAGELTREQVIDRIIQINPSATTRFLDRFAEAPLRTYLDHLVAKSAPRGRAARWCRPGDTRAIEAREAE